LRQAQRILILQNEKENADSHRPAGDVSSLYAKKIKCGCTLRQAQRILILQNEKVKCGCTSPCWRCILTLCKENKVRMHVAFGNESSNF